MRERTRYLLAYFKTHPCKDCGEPDLVMLEFDHLGDKKFNISAALPCRNWDSVLAEISKCEVSARTAIGGGPRVAAASSARSWRRLDKRATRIELVPRPWKGHVQPLHHARAVPRS